MRSRKLNREQNRRRKFVQAMVKEVMNKPEALAASPQVRQTLESKARTFALEAFSKALARE